MTTRLYAVSRHIEQTARKGTVHDHLAAWLALVAPEQVRPHIVAALLFGAALRRRYDADPHAALCPWHKFEQGVLDVVGRSGNAFGAKIDERTASVWVGKSPPFSLSTAELVAAFGEEATGRLLASDNMSDAGRLELAHELAKAWLERAAPHIERHQQSALSGLRWTRYRQRGTTAPETREIWNELRELGGPCTVQQLSRSIAVAVTAYVAGGLGLDPDLERWLAENLEHTDPPIRLSARRLVLRGLPATIAPAQVLKALQVNLIAARAAIYRSQDRVDAAARMVSMLSQHLQVRFML